MSLMTAPVENRCAGDQARELRALVAMRATATRLPANDLSDTCRTVTLVSGKGGVGKSVIALNLAIALARSGSATGLLDASSGTGNLGLLCGQNGYWNLDHVATGARGLEDILLNGPHGIQIVPGASHLLGDSETKPGLLRDLSTFERQHQWQIVDTGSDLSSARWFAAASDCTLIVTTPDPTAIAEAYSAMKALAATGIMSIAVLVNQAESNHQALQILDRLRHAARAFLGSDIGMAGFIPFDRSVSQSVLRRVPLLETDAAGPAAQALEQIGQRLIRTLPNRRVSFVETLERLRADRVGTIRSARLEGESVESRI